VTNKCVPQTSAFQADPGWQDMEFSMDEPSQYYYSYEGGSDIATAFAIGDLDCNKSESTWVLKLAAVSNGTGGSSAYTGASATLIPPPKGTY
jgi:hypothetical protein